MVEVSIITTSLNKGKWLKECIESVNQQRNNVFKINHLIVDAGSIDESIEALKEASKKPGRETAIYINPQQSQTQSLNWAFDRLRLEYPNTEYIGWINADDRYRSKWLSSSLEAFLEKQCDMTCSMYYTVTGRGDKIEINTQTPFLNNFNSLNLDMFKGRNPVCQPTVLISYRRLYELKQYTGYVWNPSYEYTQDYELWVRLLKTIPKFKICYIREVLAEFRVYPMQMSRVKVDLMKKDFDRVQEMFK